MKSAFIVASVILQFTISACAGEPEGKTERPVPPGVLALRGKCTFTLESGEESHKRNPDTFWIPPLKDRKTLKSGDLVKLMFCITNGKEEQVERMWVIVKTVKEKGYVGVLDNDPFCTDTIKSGIEVEFQAKHVIDIERGK